MRDFEFSADFCQQFGSPHALRFSPFGREEKMFMRSPLTLLDAIRKLFPGQGDRSTPSFNVNFIRERWQHLRVGNGKQSV